MSKAPNKILLYAIPPQGLVGPQNGQVGPIIKLGYCTVGLTKTIKNKVFSLNE